MLAAKRLAAFFAVLTLLALPASAGILDGHADAYDDGSTTWTGSVSFNNPASGLAGTLDYAVFTVADYQANFGGLGYTAGAGDALVYTYQVLNTGADAISAEIVGIANEANAIGSFNIGDVQPSYQAFTPNATWQFLEGVNHALNTNETSWGLAFSSPNAPMNGVSLTIDGGTSAVAFNVPTPGATAIPEPSVLALLASGITMLFWFRRRR